MFPFDHFCNRKSTTDHDTALSLSVCLFANRKIFNSFFECVEWKKDLRCYYKNGVHFVVNTFHKSKRGLGFICLLSSSSSCDDEQPLSSLSLSLSLTFHVCWVFCVKISSNLFHLQTVTSYSFSLIYISCVPIVRCWMMMKMVITVEDRFIKKSSIFNFKKYISCLFLKNCQPWMKNEANQTRCQSYKLKIM